MAALKTVLVVHMVWQGPTGETMEVSFNTDDGALQTYSGPGPGWVLISSETTEDQQIDYGDYNQFSSVYGVELADEGVKQGLVSAPSVNYPQNVPQVASPFDSAGIARPLSNVASASPLSLQSIPLTYFVLGLFAVYVIIRSL